MAQELPPNPDSPQKQTTPTPSPTLSAAASPLPSSNPKASPKRKPNARKSAITFLIVLGVLTVVLLLLSLIPFDQLSEKVTEVTETPAVTLSPIFFDTPDYEEDLTADSAYMDLDRYLHFTTQTGETFTIDEDAAEQGKVCELFDRFRTAVIAGDCDAYNALFTDEYIEKKGAAEFAPQKLYNIQVSVLSSEVLTEGDSKGLYQGATVTYCKVAYCIKDNNGTFRADFYRDGDSIAQIFEILDYKGETKISQISTPKQTILNQTDEKEGLPIMFFVWIALIVLAIVAEAMTTSLVAIWFVPGALVSMILALADIHIYAQVITYVVSALVLLIVFKLLSKKFGKKKSFTPTNSDRIVGGMGIVTEAIDNVAATGEVKIDGKRWTARSESGELIAEGNRVKVLRIEGVKLICTPDAPSKD